MEKYLIFLLVFFSNPIYSQKIKIVDEKNKPIYNVALFNNNLSLAVFTNFSGETDISIFKENDSITVQHPSFNTKTIVKDKDINRVVILETKIIEINEVIVSASKWEESSRETSNKVFRLSEKKIEEISPQTSADLLEKSGEVFVQKSQLGGGSPMIRGFSANRILLTVDGVRLNNIIYRSGNIHNIIGIDPNILEGVEVLFGPASVIYGSDALGGSINFKIKDPVFNLSQTKFYSTQKIQYNSSSNSKNYSINFAINSKKIATLTSLSLSSYQDLRSGNRRNEKYKGFGFRDEYVKRNISNQFDEIIINQDRNIQKFSGYSQLDLINKINFKINNTANIIYGLYISKSSNIPRYDRLILYNDVFTPKFSEWYYGPNEFILNKIQFNNFSKSKFYDAFKINLGLQSVKESRHSRLFNSEYLNNRNEKVSIFSLNFDFDKKFNNNEIFYGYEFLHNYVKSEANKINIISNSTESISTRYPDNGSNFISNSLYISLKRKIRNMFFNIGVRGSSSILESSLSNTFYNFPFDNIDVKTSSLSSNIGLRYNFNNSSFKFHYSNGYRSPNLDDIGKIFDSEPGVIIIPNSNLKEEFVHNLELSYLYNSKKLNINNSFYFIRLENAIIRGEGILDGKDSVFYDGTLSKVIQLFNGGKANVYGISNKISYKISRNFELEHTLSFNNSQDLLNNTPLRHSPPLFGKFLISYTSNKYNFGYFLHYNGKKSIENFSDSELNKLYLYTKYGSPAWMTHNLFFNFNFNYFMNLDFGFENIFDVHYRTYSSGISAPGRNIRLGIKLKF